MNPKLNQLDLIVRDVPEATKFFRQVVGLPVRFADPLFAELDAGGGFTLMLSPDALVPTRKRVCALSALRRTRGFSERRYCAGERKVE